MVNKSVTIRVRRIRVKLVINRLVSGVTGDHTDVGRCLRATSSPEGCLTHLLLRESTSRLRCGVRRYLLVATHSRSLLW